MRNRPLPRSELERGKVARSAEMLLGNMMARNETRRENEIGEDDNDGAPWKESTEYDPKSQTLTKIGHLGGKHKKRARNMTKHIQQRCCWGTLENYISKTRICEP